MSGSPPGVGVRPDADSRDPPPQHRIAVMHGDRGGDAVALTFDDGPVSTTAEVIRILDRGGARGTFFLVGKKIPGNEVLVRSIVRRGHEVGNHSFHHLMFPTTEDISASTALIRSVTGAPPRLYRPPFGAIDRSTSVAARATGLTSVRWDVDSEDVFPVWEGISAEEIYDRVVGGIRPGSIVLMHDGCLWSKVADALPAIVATLSERGYRMVTVSELLGASTSTEPRMAERGNGGPAQTRPRSGARRIQAALRRATGPRPATVVVGHEPPVSEEELAAMPPHRVIVMLEGLDADALGGAAFEGTARLFSERVVENPAAFAEHADRLVALGPGVVAAALRGLETAVRKWRGMRWGGALTLVEATLPRHEPGAGARPPDRPQDLDRARDRALALLEAGLEEQVLPMDLRDRVWRALEALSWDFDGQGPEAPPRRTSAEDIRRRALGTIVSYIGWVRGGSEGADAPPPPEARANLDAHLDPEREPSPEMRAALGMRLPLLHEVDPEWLSERLDAILPADEVPFAERLPAWNRFLMWTLPTPELFSLLEDRYRLVLADLPTPVERRRPDHADRVKGLARHLESLYRAGALGLEEGGVVRTFAERAAADELAYLVSAVGLFLHREDARLDLAGARRSMDLWDRLVEWTESRDEAGRRTALAPFGVWHASGALDPDWVDDRLAALLRAGIRAEPEFTVFARLAERAAANPERATYLAGLYVELIDDRWRLFSVRDALTTVLKAGRAASDPEVQARARAVERAARARGFPDFPSLLEAA